MIKENLFNKYKIYSKFIFLLLLISINNNLYAQNNPKDNKQLQLPVHSPVPGGVAVIELETQQQSLPPLAYFNNKQVLVVEHNNKYFAIVGIDLNTKPGKYKLSYNSDALGKKTKKFRVKNKKYHESRITIKNKNMVNPDSETQTRIANDVAKITQAINTRSDYSPSKLTFKQPVKGTRTTSFGARRIINKQRKNPHKGMDIAAPKSTPVYAAGKGTVILADNFYLSGNLVAIDHGSGLITMYAHLDKILAKVGDTVDTDNKIGLVGNTGRVTGPHLHWSVKLNQVSVDPELFLVKNKKI